MGLATFPVELIISVRIHFLPWTIAGCLMASTIRVAIVGLADPIWNIILALQATSGLKLVALADSDRERLTDCSESTGLPGYDDQRIMLLETQPQIIFINVPRHQEADLLALALELGVAVWKPYPLARNFDEAVDFVQRFAKANLGLYVGNPYRYSGGFVCLSDWLPTLGQVHLIHDEYMLPAKLTDQIAAWRTSKAQAGGGVLLDCAYPGLELITSQFGLPEQVYCLTRSQLGLQTDRPYETEDLSTLSLAFGNGTIACSTALRVAAQARRRTTWHGSAGKLTFEPRLVSLQFSNRSKPQTRHYRDRLERPYARQAHELVHALRGDQPPASTANDHLLPMAVIEAAYLSARTGQPESPSHFYELHDLTLPAPPVITSPAV